MELEEKLFKFWRKILSHDDLRIDFLPSDNMYKNNPVPYRTGYFIKSSSIEYWLEIITFIDEESPFLLRYGRSSLGIKAKIKSDSEFYSESMELYETTKVRFEDMEKTRRQEFLKEIDKTIKD